MAIVSTVFTHTGDDASANLAPVKFVHEEGFWLWGKYEENNMKRRRRTDAGPKKLMDAPGAMAMTPDREDIAGTAAQPKEKEGPDHNLLFSEVFKDNRSCGRPGTKEEPDITGEPFPLSPPMAEVPDVPGGLHIGVGEVEHRCRLFHFDVLA